MSASSIEAGRRLAIVSRHAWVAVVSVGLAASGILLSQGWDGTSASPDAQATATGTTPTPAEGWAERVEGRAALVDLCGDGLHDPDAQARYQRARAAQPSLAYGIGPDCRLIITGP
jgi:hypothetical protein